MLLRQAVHGKPVPSMRGREPRSFITLVILVLVAAMLVPASAWSAAPPKRPASQAKREKAARTLFEKAERSFNVGKFEEALSHYQAAYEELPLPAFLFNVAQCYRNLGNHERALFFYQRYLSLDPNAPNRKMVEDLLVEQQREVADAQATTPTPPPTAPSPSPADYSPPRTPDLSARNPQPSPRNVATTPAVRASAKKDKDEEGSGMLWLWIGGGVVVAGALAAVLLLGGGDLPSGKLGSIDAR